MNLRLPFKAGIEMSVWTSCNISVHLLKFELALVIQGTISARMSHVSISYRNQSFVLLCKLNYWFLHEMQHWAEIV